MFTKFPELFDRNFAVGYFLPSVIFVLVNVLFLNAFGLIPVSLQVNLGSQFDVLIDTTIIGLVSWIVGVFLITINRDVIRLIEGYGWRKIPVFNQLERRRYEAKEKAVTAAWDKVKSYPPDKIPSKYREQRNRLMWELVDQFPDKEYLLPTSFGNVMRSAEVYSRIMYGFEVTRGWSRLLTVIPESYKATLDSARALLNFWVNLWLFSCVFIIESIVVVLYFTGLGGVNFVWTMIVIPLTALCSALVAYMRARNSASEWGQLIRAASDMFLPDLHKKLGFPMPTSKEENRIQWKQFSQAIVYRLPNVMPEREVSGSDDLRRITTEDTVKRLEDS